MDIDFSTALLRASTSSPNSISNSPSTSDSSSTLPSTSTLPLPLPLPLPPPPDTSTATNAKLKVPRITRACEACRRRKTRCFGQQAEGEGCPQCVASGRACSWAPLKRSAPKNYAESLEQRCDAMEGVLRNLSLSAGVDLGTLFDEADDEEKIAALEKAAEVLDKKQKDLKIGTKTEVVDLNHCTSLETALAQEEMSIEKNRFVGPSSGPFWSRGVLRKLMEPEPLPWDGSLSPCDMLLREERDSQVDTLGLPPADLAASLIEAYFTHVNLLLPVLHGPSFCRAIQAGMMETDRSFRHLAFMVFALGARFISDSRIPVTPYSPDLDHRIHSTGARGFPYFKAAHTSTASNLVPATLFDIQASVLSITYLTGSSSPIVAWNQIGWSIRRAVDVGVHSETRVRWSTSPLEDQLRKRSFHILVANDRSISAALGRPLSLQEHEFDLQYPIDISDEALDEWNLAGPQSPPPLARSKPTALCGLLCIFNLYLLISKARRQLYGVSAASAEVGGEKTEKIVSEYDSAFNAWLGTIPQHLKWDPSMPEEFLPISAMLYCTFYNCQTLIHRERLLPKPQVRSTLPSLAICSNASRSTAHILEILMNNNKLHDAFWYAPLQVAGAGMVLIINTITTGGRTSDGKPMAAFKDVERCIAVSEALSIGSFMAWRVKSHLAKMLNVVSSRVCPPSSTINMIDQPVPSPPPAPSELAVPQQLYAFSTSSPTLSDLATTEFTSNPDFGLPMDLMSPEYLPTTLTDPGTDWMEALGGNFDFEAWTRSLDSGGEGLSAWN